MLNGSTWDADRVRDDLQAYAQEHLGHPEEVLVLDETGFLTWVCSANTAARRDRWRTVNARGAPDVFLAYVSPYGQTFLDREFYLPKSGRKIPTGGKRRGLIGAIIDDNPCTSVLPVLMTRQLHHL